MYLNLCLSMFCVVLIAEEKDPSTRGSKFFEENDEIKTPKEIFFWGLPWLKRIVTGYPFELFFVTLIIVNCGTMMAQIELIGGKLAYEVGLQATPVNTMDEFFFYAELCFGIAFTFEICLKFVAFGILGFWKLTWNWMDLFVAGTSAGLVDERSHVSRLMAGSWRRVSLQRGPHLDYRCAWGRG